MQYTSVCTLYSIQCTMRIFKLLSVVKCSMHIFKLPCALCTVCHMRIFKLLCGEVYCVKWTVYYVHRGLFVICASLNCSLVQFTMRIFRLLSVVKCTVRIYGEVYCVKWTVYYAHL